MLQIDRLQAGLTPRLRGVSQVHVGLLMEVLDQLPPILVQRGTNMVVDGMHRLEAFRRSGRTTIPARLLDGDQRQLFVLAVEANVAHGMALSLAERRQSAARILGDFPEYSDRWLGQICGLSHSTVARIREGLATPDNRPPDRRLGRDGRRRSSQRLPSQSDVRPSVELRNRDTPETESVLVVRHAVDHPARSGVDVGHDVALQSVEELATFTDWLSSTALSDDDWERHLAAIPIGRLYAVADECRRRAKSWTMFADALEQRARRRARSKT